MTNREAVVSTQSTGCFSSKGLLPPPSEWHPWSKDQLFDDAIVYHVDLPEADAWEFQLERIKGWEEKRCKASATNIHGDNIMNITIEVKHRYHCTIISLPIFISSYIYDRHECEVLISGVSGMVEGHVPFGYGPFSAIPNKAYQVFKQILGYYSSNDAVPTTSTCDGGDDDVDS
eukprot:TRINITY_DN5686_c0_g2_i1.p1 TRINITY_DN5686_c0_g2~~TRINITY_DN5686_c0_g2_i1.p1  ORF type:complete len:174 (+),score=35.78 TRINITY_DN5686_c0_g2_i1:65-586(+)